MLQCCRAAFSFELVDEMKARTVSASLACFSAYFSSCNFLDVLLKNENCQIAALYYHHDCRWQVIDSSIEAPLLIPMTSHFLQFSCSNFNFLPRLTSNKTLRNFESPPHFFEKNDLQKFALRKHTSSSYI